MVAMGNYDQVNARVTASAFPTNDRSVRELVAEIVHPNRWLSSEDVAAGIVKLNLRLARVEELLTFGSAYPEVQRLFPMVCLGSMAEIDGRLTVPSLYEWDGERRLGLDFWDSPWSSHYRFLTVRL